MKNSKLVQLLNKVESLSNETPELQFHFYAEPLTEDLSKNLKGGMRVITNNNCNGSVNVSCINNACTNTSNYVCTNN